MGYRDTSIDDDSKIVLIVNENGGRNHRHTAIILQWNESHSYALERPEIVQSHLSYGLFTSTILSIVRNWGTFL